MENNKLNIPPDIRQEAFKEMKAGGNSIQTQDKTKPWILCIQRNTKWQWRLGPAHRKCQASWKRHPGRACKGYLFYKHNRWNWRPYCPASPKQNNQVWAHNPLGYRSWNGSPDKGSPLIDKYHGRDVEAGLAISELVASITKPTVSIVLGGDTA